MSRDPQMPFVWLEELCVPEGVRERTPQSPPESYLVAKSDEIVFLIINA